MIKVPEISHEELLISLIKNLRPVYSVMITLKEVRECFQNANDIFNSEIDKYIFVKAGAKKLIKKLHRKGVKIGLVTSDSIGHATTMLHRNGLLQYFATLIGGNSIHGEKHTGKPCEEVLDRMGVDPKKCVTIGDMPIDIHMANMNNMLAGIGVYNGYTPLNKYTPYVVNSLREVHVKGF